MTIFLGFVFYLLCLNKASCLLEQDSFDTFYVSMRDGLKLAVDVYRVKFGQQLPVVLEITPYYRKGLFNFRIEADFWYENGYIFVVADSRGTGDSESEFDLMRNEAEDGYDLIEWISKQTWSNGRVGMRGGSYSGTNQLHIAAKQHPSLKCLNPSATLANPFEQMPYIGGTFAVQWALNWIGKSLKLNLTQNSTWIHNDPLEWLQYRPLNKLDSYVTGQELPLYQRFVNNPLNDSFWTQIMLQQDHYRNIKIPTLAFTGWFDSTLLGTIIHFKNLRKYSPNKDNHFIIIGPYTHMTAPDGGYDFETDQPQNKIGELYFPDNAFYPGKNLTKQFFDWCLKNVSNKPNWSNSRIYINDEWVNETDYPPKNSKIKYLYLTNEKGLTNCAPFTWSNDTFTYNPLDPVRSDLSGLDLSLPIDIRSFFQNRSDILVYTSEPLEKPMIVTGETTVELSISTNVKDTDFVVFLMDVFEDGRSVKLGSMNSRSLRLRYRNGYDREELLKPGEIYNIKISLNEIGHVFKKGNRIRLAVTSSFYPFLSANPNTGLPIAYDTSRPLVAQQTIHYGNPIFDFKSRIKFTVL